MDQMRVEKSGTLKVAYVRPEGNMPGESGHAVIQDCLNRGKIPFVLRTLTAVLNPAEFTAAILNCSGVKSRTYADWIDTLELEIPLILVVRIPAQYTRCIKSLYPDRKIHVATLRQLAPLVKSMR